MELVIEMYAITKTFPSNEAFGLQDQIRRAAVSVPSNVAEGAARHTLKELKHFLHIAQGSLSELDTQLEIARRLHYVRGNDWQRLDEKMERVDKMLSGLIRRQKTPPASRLSP